LKPKPFSPVHRARKFWQHTRRRPQHTESQHTTQHRQSGGWLCQTVWVSTLVA
jgi:hypothetical protein